MSNPNVEALAKALAEADRAFRLAEEYPALEGNSIELFAEYLAAKGVVALSPIGMVTLLGLFNSTIATATVEADTLPDLLVGQTWRCGLYPVTPEPDPPFTTPEATK